MTQVKCDTNNALATVQYNNYIFQDLISSFFQDVPTCTRAIACTSNNFVMYSVKCVNNF